MHTITVKEKDYREMKEDTEKFLKGLEKGGAVSIIVYLIGKEIEEQRLKVTVDVIKNYIECIRGTYKEIDLIVRGLGENMKKEYLRLLKWDIVTGLNGKIYKLVEESAMKKYRKKV